MTSLRSAGFDAGSTIEDVAKATGMDPVEVLLQTRLQSLDDSLAEVLDKPFEFPDDFSLDADATVDDVEGVRSRDDFALDSGRTSTGAAHLMRFKMGAVDVIRPQDLIETTIDTWRARLNDNADDPVARREVLSELSKDVQRDKAKLDRAFDGELKGVPKGNSPHVDALRASFGAKEQLLQASVGDNIEVA